MPEGMSGICPYCHRCKCFKCKYILTMTVLQKHVKTECKCRHACSNCTEALTPAPGVRYLCLFTDKG